MFKCCKICNLLPAIQFILDLKQKLNLFSRTHITYCIKAPLLPNAHYCYSTLSNARQQYLARAGAQWVNEFWIDNKLSLLAMHSTLSTCNVISATKIGPNASFCNHFHLLIHLIINQVQHLTLKAQIEVVDWGLFAGQILNFATSYTSTDRGLRKCTVAANRNLCHATFVTLYLQKYSD